MTSSGRLTTPPPGANRKDPVVDVGLRAGAAVPTTLAPRSSVPEIS